MQILATIRTNWRDIVAGILITFGSALLADYLQRLAISSDGNVWLANLVSPLRGFSHFAGANLAAFFMFALAWPLVNKHMNFNFADSWKCLTSQQKFFVIIALSIGYLLAAAICFSGPN